MTLSDEDRKAVDARIWVDVKLAAALDMYIGRADSDGRIETTVRSLGRYVADAVMPNSTRFYGDDIGIAAYRYFMAIAMALTPPADRRMAFDDRSLHAAHAAVPKDYLELVALVLDLGWGRSIPVHGNSLFEACDGLREAVIERTMQLTDKLLARWEREEHVFRL